MGSLQPLPKTRGYFPTKNDMKICFQTVSVKLKAVPSFLPLNTYSSPTGGFNTFYWNGFQVII